MIANVFHYCGRVQLFKRCKRTIKQQFPLKSLSYFYRVLEWCCTFLCVVRYHLMAALCKAYARVSWMEDSEFLSLCPQVSKSILYNFFKAVFLITFKTNTVVITSVDSALF